MHLCKQTGTFFDRLQVLLEYCSVLGWPSQLSAVCLNSRICWWSNNTNPSSVPILLFKVCALSIKFASDFSVKSSSLEVIEQPFFLTFWCQSLTWAPCLYGMGQLPLFICPPPPLLINLLPPPLYFFSLAGGPRIEAGWKECRFFLREAQQRKSPND